MRIMKKYFYNLLTAATLVALGVSVTSCSTTNDNPVVIEDDTPAPTVSVSSELLSKGIYADMKSAVEKVEVRCDGEWVAVTPKEDEMWLDILDWAPTYKGNKTLTLMIDENNTGKSRESKLMLVDGDGKVTNIKVYQASNRMQSNSSGLNFFAKGLGCGLNYDYILDLRSNILREGGSEKFDPLNCRKSNNVFNILQIDKLMKQAVDPLSPLAYVESIIPIAQLDAVLYDSCIAQDKTLEVGLDLELSFGPVSGRANGQYSSHAQEERDYINYTIVRKAPMYDAYLSPAELSAYANSPLHNKMDFDLDDAAYAIIDKWIEKYVKQNNRQHITDVNWRGLTEEQEAIISSMEVEVAGGYDFAGIFSAGFTNRYNELYQALEIPRLAGKEPDYTKVDQILNAIDNEYGPFFIVGGEYGGNLTVDCQVMKDYLDGESQLSGNVEAEMSGHFSMSGHIEYSEKGMSLLRNSNTQIYMYGGSAQESTTELMKLIWGEKPSNLETWINAMEKWIGSMWSGTGDNPQESMAAPVAFRITPIWTLFSYASIQSYAQEYFIKKYKNRGIEGYLGIMTGKTEGGQAEEASNLNSEIWQGTTGEKSEE